MIEAHGFDAVVDVIHAQDACMRQMPSKRGTVEKTIRMTVDSVYRLTVLRA